MTKIDKQLEEYDQSVGDRLNMFSTDHEGKIAVKDLKSALEVIRHSPSEEEIAILLQKLDIDNDSWVPLDDIVSLAEGEGLGIVMEEEKAIELKENAKEVKVAAQEGFADASSRAAASDAHKAEKGAEEESKKKKEEKPKLKKEDVVEG